MKEVKITMTFVFEVEDSDDESIKEGLKNAFEELDENDELLIGKTRVKIKDLDEEEEKELEEEDEDDDE